MHWGGLGDYPETVFKIGEFTKRPFEFNNSVHISVTFEVDLDLKVIERQVYNILDWIGDVGGLGEGCFFISYTILGIIHFGALDNMIISELFRIDKSIDDKKSPSGSPSGKVAPQSIGLTTERSFASPQLTVTEHEEKGGNVT